MKPSRRHTTPRARRSTHFAVGRIIEPNDAALGRADYGFELVLPPGLGPVDGIGAAQIIDAALARRTAAKNLEPVALAA